MLLTQTTTDGKTQEVFPPLCPNYVVAEQPACHFPPYGAPLPGGLANKQWLLRAFVDHPALPTTHILLR